MKLITIILFSVFLGCHTSSKTPAAPVEKTDLGKKEVTDSLPVCVKVLIEKFKSEEKTNPPRAIYSYTFREKTVYYVPPVCCDQFSDLYNDSCRLMGHPDGGFSGRGDGKFRDFRDEKTNEKLLWKDER